MSLFQLSGGFLDPPSVQDFVLLKFSVTLNHTEGDKIGFRKIHSFKLKKSSNIFAECENIINNYSLKQGKFLYFRT